MTSASPSAVALAIPEVLSLVAECIPLWNPHESGRFLFRPATLLRLCRVSKTWQQALVPVLWRFHSSLEQLRVPLSVLEENSVHARFYRENFAVARITLYDFSLVRRMWVEDKGTVALKWIRPTSVLTHLHWNDISSKVSPNLRDLFGSIQSPLTILQFHRWDIPPRILLDILARLPHLTSLSLSLASPHIRAMALPEATYPPLHLKEFTTDITETNTRLFRHVLAYSPDLERLVFQGDFPRHEELPEVVQNPFLLQGLELAREFCPNIKTVQLRYSCPRHLFKGRSRFLAVVAVSGQVGSGRLLQLKALVHSFQGSISKMIFREASTLQSIKITSTRDAVEMNARNLLKLIKSPKFLHLHTLHFSGEYQLTKVATSALFEMKWACVHLERLLLDGLWSLKSEDKTPLTVLPNGEAAKWRPAWEESRFGVRLQELVHLRLNELSKLREVSLNGVWYKNVHH